MLALVVAGCATSNSSEPSLAPRTAEAIDPRLPIASEPALGPVDPALAARLGQLVADGKQGARTFAAALPAAEALAAAAGPSESESWILAQQALSGLEAARGASTRAQGDLDTLTAGRVQTGGLPAGDLAAVEAASAELREITDRQARAIDALAARLSR